jgi:anaphase-promoting complex subunit 5
MAGRDAGTSLLPSNARCSTLYPENIQSPASLREAIPYLKIAEADYLKIEIYAAARRVQYVLSVVYNTLNMKAERDAAVKRLGETEEKSKMVSGEAADAQMIEIINLVSEVGVGLAARE